MKGEYDYRNMIGIEKRISFVEKDGIYEFSVWNMQNGEFCGSGTATKEEFENFLSHYEITKVWEEK